MTTRAPTKANPQGQPEQKIGPAEAQRVFGVSGLRNLGNRINEEYLTVLKDWEKAKKIYLQMQDDATIGAMLDALTLPLLAADFDTEAASDAQGDQDAAMWLEEAMNGMVHQSWRSHVTDVLGAIAWGFAVSEITLEKRDDGRLWPRNLAPRSQDSLYKWDFDADDRATAMWQHDPDTGALLQVPLDKCIHVTFRGRKGNPQGYPLLRSVFKDWRFKTNLEDMEGIGVERDVGGMPVFTLPTEQLSAAEITALQLALKGLRMDEEMYFIVPHDSTLVAYAGGSKSYDIGAIIERKEKTILMRGFAQFLKLGMDNVGTQALVEGSQDFFMLSLQSCQQQLLEVWNDQLVPFLFRFNNFPGMTDLPQIKWNNPGRVDIKPLVEAYKLAKDAGAITPIIEDEDFFRSRMDLPDLPEGMGLEPRDQIEQPMVFPTEAMPNA